MTAAWNAQKTGPDVAGRSLARTAIERLRSRLSGDIVHSADARYDSARRVWNGMIDRRPAAIVYCAGVEDVRRCIALASEGGVRFAVRSGGHNIAGVSICDGGLVIDLSRMNGVAVNVRRRTAQAEGGALLRDLDAATQAHGLATTTGVNSDTGLVGLTLGGGIGRLGRKHGLACDNMLSAEIIAADGRLLTASDEENPDLYWALRGGGGNFGVVTSIAYRTHPLGPAVLAGSLVYDWEHARRALRLYANAAAVAPDELCLDGALHSLPGGGFGFSISVCYAGPVAEGERIVGLLRRAAPTIADRVGVLRYAELQRAGDTTFPHGRRYYWKAQFLSDLSDELIGALLDRFPAVASPQSLFVLQQVGGAIARVPAEATAYANRAAAYDAFPVSIWTEPGDDEANVAWARGMYDAVRPFATGGVYVNNLGDEGQDRIRAAYGVNYDRLMSVKRKFDPGNIFRSNQNLTV